MKRCAQQVSVSGMLPQSRDHYLSGRHGSDFPQTDLRDHAFKASAFHIAGGGTTRIFIDDLEQTQAISRLLREMQTQFANLENGVSEEVRNDTKLMAGLRRDFNKNFLRRWFGSFFRLYANRRDDSGVD